MAKQNFLAGGFYGKLGAFVGQRWKNIRTIRSYVVPHNPKTPMQQANRKVFGSVVPLAQLANTVNYGCPAFNTSENTQWAFRMQQGTELLKAGETGLNLIPLYPRDFIVPSVINSVTLERIVNNTSLSFSFGGEVPTTERLASILLLFNDGAREGETLLLCGENTAENPNIFTCVCEDTSEIRDSDISVRVCSRDDETVETIFASVQMSLQKSLEEPFNTEILIKSVSVNTDGTVDLIVYTENAYDTNVAGSVAFTVSSASGTKALKDGTAGSIATTDFTLAPTLQDVDGKQGWAIAITPTVTATNGKNWTAELEISANFTNYKTSNTLPNTGTSAVSKSLSWNNAQASYAITFGAASVASNNNGTATVTIPITSDMPINASTCLALTLQSASGSVGLKADAATNNNVTLASGTAIGASEFTASSVNIDTAGKKITFIVQSSRKNEINGYTVAITAKVTSTNAYTANTMPASADTTAVNNLSLPTFMQPQYSTTIAYGTATIASNNNGTATVTIPITSDMPINASTCLTVALQSVTGTVGLKENAVFNGNVSLASGTAIGASEFTASSVNIDTAGKKITFIVQSSRKNEINGYTVAITTKVTAKNPYTADTRPKNTQTANTNSASMPTFVQPQFTVPASLSVVLSAGSLSNGEWEPLITSLNGNTAGWINGETETGEMVSGTVDCEDGNSYSDDSDISWSAGDWTDVLPAQLWLGMASMDDDSPVTAMSGTFKIYGWVYYFATNDTRAVNMGSKQFTGNITVTL